MNLITRLFFTRAVSTLYIPLLQIWIFSLIIAISTEYNSEKANECIYHCVRVISRIPRKIVKCEYEKCFEPYFENYITVLILRVHYSYLRVSMQVGVSRERRVRCLSMSINQLEIKRHLESFVKFQASFRCLLSFSSLLWAEENACPMECSHEGAATKCRRELLSS